jgi:hypothetical protein
LEGEAILQTTAEVSVALAGFTGVVAAFGQRRGHWASIDTVRFRVMLLTSLAALVFSILPFAVHHMNATSATTWAVSSALLASYLVVHVFIDTHRLRNGEIPKDPQFRAWSLALAYSLAGAAVVIQVLNALDIVFHRAFGPFLLGLCCLLLICTQMFIRLLSFVGQQLGEE